MPVTRQDVDKAIQDRDAALEKQKSLQSQLQDLDSASDKNQTDLKNTNRKIASGTGTASEKVAQQAQAQQDAANAQRAINSQKQALEKQLSKQKEDVKLKETAAKEADAELFRQSASGQADAARTAAGKNEPDIDKFRPTTCPACKSLEKSLSTQIINYQTKLTPSYEQIRKHLGGLADSIDDGTKSLEVEQVELDRALAALAAGQQVLQNRGPRSDLLRNIEDYKQHVAALALAMMITKEAMTKDLADMKTTNTDLDKKYLGLVQAQQAIFQTLNQMKGCEASQCPPGRASVTKTNNTTALKDTVSTAVDTGTIPDTPTAPKQTDQAKVAQQSAAAAAGSPAPPPPSAPIQVGPTPELSVPANTPPTTGAPNPLTGTLTSTGTIGTGITIIQNPTEGAGSGVPQVNTSFNPGGA